MLVVYRLVRRNGIECLVGVLEWLLEVCKLFLFITVDLMLSSHMTYVLICLLRADGRRMDISEVGWVEVLYKQDGVVCLYERCYRQYKVYRLWRLYLPRSCKIGQQHAWKPARPAVPRPRASCPEQLFAPRPLTTRTAAPDAENCSDIDHAYVQTAT